MRPNFLVIGAARSGTTWIAKNLSEHPEVFLPQTKEVHFFDAQYEKGLPFYESFFTDLGKAHAIGEATPAYLHNEAAAGRIKQHLPDVKMIACLRNPVDRVYSRYWNARGRFAKNLNLSFEEKLKQKPEFIAEGFYADHLKRFFALFPREQFLILFYEQLSLDPLGFMRRIHHFIGVDETFHSEQLQRRINAAATQRLAVQSRTSYWVTKGFEKLGMHWLAGTLESRNASTIPPMASATRRWLTETVYAEKVQELEALLGESLSSWREV